MFSDGISGFHFLKIAGIYAFLVILFVMSVVELPFLGAEGGRLAFFLIGLYFWSVYRPHLLPYPVVFLSGLLLDFVSGGLVGLYALCFMVIVMIVRGQRRFLQGQSWPVIWAGFAVAVCVVMIVQCVAYSLANWALPPLLPIVFNLVISGLLYPLLLPVMMLLNRSVIDE